MTEIMLNIRVNGLNKNRIVEYVSVRKVVRVCVCVCVCVCACVCVGARVYV